MTKNNRMIETVAKRIAVGTISVLMTASCAVPSFAGESDNTREGDRLIICGNVVDKTQEASGDGWYYDPSDNSLTLNGFTYTGCGTFLIDVVPCEDDDSAEAEDIETIDDNVDLWCEDCEDDDFCDEEDDDWDDDEEEGWDDDEVEDWDDSDNEEWCEDTADEEYADRPDVEFGGDIEEDADITVVEEIIGVIYSESTLNLRIVGYNEITVYETDPKAGLNFRYGFCLSPNGELYIRGTGWDRSYEELDYMSPDSRTVTFKDERLVLADANVSANEDIASSDSNVEADEADDIPGAEEDNNEITDGDDIADSFVDTVEGATENITDSESFEDDSVSETTLINNDDSVLETEDANYTDDFEGEVESYKAPDINYVSRITREVYEFVYDIVSDSSNNSSGTVTDAESYKGELAVISTDDQEEDGSMKYTSPDTADSLSIGKLARVILITISSTLALIGMIRRRLHDRA